MDERANPSEARALNRARWDELATIHGQDAYYDTRALLAGRSSLTEEENAAMREAVGDVTGLDVLHVQCHIGFDSISLARRGARVTGVDFSPVALEKVGAIHSSTGRAAGGPRRASACDHARHERSPGSRLPVRRRRRAPLGEPGVRPGRPEPAGVSPTRQLW